MFSQGEQGQEGLGMCLIVGSIAPDGSYYYHPTTNGNQWGRSPFSDGIGVRSLVSAIRSIIMKVGSMTFPMVDLEMMFEVARMEVLSFLKEDS